MSSSFNYEVMKTYREPDITLDHENYINALGEHCGIEKEQARTHYINKSRKQIILDAEQLGCAHRGFMVAASIVGTIAVGLKIAMVANVAALGGAIIPLIGIALGLAGIGIGILVCRHISAIKHKYDPKTLREFGIGMLYGAIAGAAVAVTLAIIIFIAALAAKADERNKSNGGSRPVHHHYHGGSNNFFSGFLFGMMMNDRRDCYYRHDIIIIAQPTTLELNTESAEAKEHRKYIDEQSHRFLQDKDGKDYFYRGDGIITSKPALALGG